MRRRSERRLGPQEVNILPLKETGEIVETKEGRKLRKKRMSNVNCKEKEGQKGIRESAGDKSDSKGREEIRKEDWQRRVRRKTKIRSRGIVKG